MSFLCQENTCVFNNNLVGPEPITTSPIFNSNNNKKKQKKHKQQRLQSPILISIPTNQSIPTSNVDFNERLQQLQPVPSTTQMSSTPVSCIIHDHPYDGIDDQQLNHRIGINGISILTPLIYSVVNLNYNIDSDSNIIKYTTKRYKQQKIYNMFRKSNKSLTFIISFCILNNIPELLYNLMDCYTKDRIEYISTTTKDISITDWINCNSFFQTIKYHSNKWYHRWEYGFRVYINRIIPKMNIQDISPQIDDSIEDIIHYLIQTPLFVFNSDWYTDTCIVNLPFQLDIAITVKNVSYLKELLDIDDNIDSDDDDDEDDDDHNGNIKDIYTNKANKNKYWWIDDKYTKHKIKYTDNSYDFTIGHNTKMLYGKYQQILTRMFRNKRCDKQRICMLVDRRDTKLEPAKIKAKMKEIQEIIVYGYIRSIENEMRSQYAPYDIYNLCVKMMYDNNNNTYPNNLQYDPHNVTATIFIPPIYNQIPKNTVNEFYHYSSQKCVIPTNIGYITSLNSTQYNVLLFSIHAKEADQVQCYLHWNGKTIRVFPKNMLQLLPKLFYPNEINQDYLNSSQSNRSTNYKFRLFQKRINSALLDSKFEKIYNSIHLCT